MLLNYAEESCTLAEILITAPCEGVPGAHLFSLCQLYQRNRVANEQYFTIIHGQKQYDGSTSGRAKLLRRIITLTFLLRKCFSAPNYMFI